jgi:hypothetical protein
MSEPTTTPVVETWRDWLPKDEPDPAGDQLLTRQELIARLAESGVDVSMPNLRKWEYLGITPGPVRRRREGSARAVYPIWMIPLLALVRKMQAEGRSLAEIRDRLQAEARPLIERGGSHLELFIDNATAELSPSAFRKQILDLVRRHEQVSGNFVSRLTIRYSHENEDEEPAITWQMRSR